MSANMFVNVQELSVLRNCCRLEGILQLKYVKMSESFCSLSHSSKKREESRVLRHQGREDRLREKGPQDLGLRTMATMVTLQRNSEVKVHSMLSREESGRPFRKHRNLSLFCLAFCLTLWGSYVPSDRLSGV